MAHDIFWTDGQFDYYMLASVVKTATRFLDNVGSENHFPTPKFQKWYEENRPVGLGIMGLADAFLRAEMVYGSNDSLNFAARIMKTLKDFSYLASEELGQEKGIPKQCQHPEIRRRNITTVSNAPTGSIAIMAECSHGVEPIFSPLYVRTDERGETYEVQHALADEPYFSSVVGSQRSPTWKQHVDIQTHMQKHCDSGISKTINFQNSASVQDVYDAMAYAWKNGAKGITVYRDGSRMIQVLNSKEAPEAEKAPEPDKFCDCESPKVVMSEGCMYCEACNVSLCTV